MYWHRKWFVVNRYASLRELLQRGDVAPSWEMESLLKKNWCEVHAKLVKDPSENELTL